MPEKSFAHIFVEFSTYGPFSVTSFFTFYQVVSGQAVVTGAVRYVPSFSSGIGFSIPTALRLSSSMANSRSRAFCQPIYIKEKTLYICICTRDKDCTPAIDFKCTIASYQATAAVSRNINSQPKLIFQ